MRNCNDSSVWQASIERLLLCGIPAPVPAGEKKPLTRCNLKALTYNGQRRPNAHARTPAIRQCLQSERHYRPPIPSVCHNQFRPGCKPSHDLSPAVRVTIAFMPPAWRYRMVRHRVAHIKLHEPPQYGLESHITHPGCSALPTFVQLA